MSNTGKNTDRELWRKIEGDYYSPSIHTTVADEIAIQVGGFVIVMPVEKWHELGREFFKKDEIKDDNKPSD